ncbi:sugar lactone lactonase YvrE [Pseudonocardia sediminis]|uniref:Sugar lactone lactonase YvrE n=1 Tax=Pseudonocardia sediminis TaxID=1397368 RepID=A0A4Q7UPW6_PSEST|nr:SMP-30/gluconolactonase/LRE family protein [Pseudonocardia sediminis]RZT83772.1 sugar lactone lactonase YvrE [Pseudonocardia sediminis]
MTVTADDLKRIGSDLNRPESVLATAAGDLYTSNADGGVSHIRPDGGQTRYLGTTADLPDGLHPNGIALEADGSFLIAHLGQGEREGGVFRLQRDGQLTPELREVDGVALPPTNHVTRDHRGRLWITVSTTVHPRDTDFTADAKSGFVVFDDGRGPRIVADGLGYTNECLPSPDGRWLYVNETFTKRLSRFPLSESGEPGPKEVLAEFGPGEFPDGLALDVDGGVWEACVVSNRVIRVLPDGTKETWLNTADRGHVEGVEEAWLSGRMRAAHIGGRGGFSPLGQVSSLAFAGPKRRTLVLGSLRNPYLVSAPAPVAGVEPPHWNVTA